MDYRDTRCRIGLFRIYALEKFFIDAIQKGLFLRITFCFRSGLFGGFVKGIERFEKSVPADVPARERVDDFLDFGGE